jgi:uncharacterized membrane protein
MLFATAALFAVTLAASFIYYRRIKQAQGEYEGAKDAVKGITLSLSRELKKATVNVGNLELKTLKATFESNEALRASSEALDAARSGLKQSQSLTGRIEENEKTINTLRAELQKIPRGSKQPFTVVDIEGPISLQQEAVMEQLTDTELDVLSMIDEIGDASVPEIKSRIGKTREHTARLLKKLYERGFIDRNTSGMPYKYHIRKEIKETIKLRKNR